MNKEAKTVIHGERSVTITRVLKAPRALVWEAWTDLKQLKEWWGPEQFTAPVVQGEVKTGGEVHITMRGPQGLALGHGSAHGDALPRNRARREAGVRE